MKKKLSKLALSKETLRNLTRTDLTGVAAGVTPACTLAVITCYLACGTQVWNSCRECGSVEIC